jgi:FkbM family methyltransferase
VEQSFVLPNGVASRSDIFAEVIKWLDGRTVRSILCTPYVESDLLLALASQALTGAPLGLWIMDDNCLTNYGISKDLMKEVIDRADALFAISPELKQAYQTEFRRSFSIVPPLVPQSLIIKTPSAVPTNSDLIMIGNIWNPQTLDQFSRTVHEAGIKLDWHSPNPSLWSSQISSEILAERGIRVVPTTDPQDLVEIITNARAVIVPSNTGEKKDGHEAALGNFSIPTRMPFVLAATGTPIIVVGRPSTAAANFVNRFGLGRAIEYDAKALREADVALGNKAEQAAIRKRAAALAPSFSFNGVFEFMTSAILDGGRRPDERFEKLFPHSGSYAIYMDKPLPKQFSRDYGEVIQLCDRLSASKFIPDFVLDVGASTGIWSIAAFKVYDKARFLLCDPMFSRYGSKMMVPAHFECIEAAISDKPGEAQFSISSDLYGSSLIAVSDIVQVTQKIRVPVRTIDEIARQKKLKGRGLLKVDVQYAEHLVIKGAKKTLEEHIDVVVLELSLARAAPTAKTLLEVSNQMNKLGFRIYDQIECWRLPKSGEMEQMDIVFVRKGVKFSSLND